MKISFLLLFAVLLCATTLIGTGCERGIEIIKPVVKDNQELTDTDDVEVMDTGDVSGHIAPIPVPVFASDEESEELVEHPD